MPKLRTVNILQEDPAKLLLAGSNLKPASVAKLEKTLKANPSDLPCRLKLLGYYSKNCYSSKLAAKKQVACTLYLIRKMPEHRILRFWPTINKVSNPADYDKCKRAWLKQLATYKNNVSVLANAAFFLKPDLKLTEKLYKRAITLDPEEAEWSRNLAWLLSCGARRNSSRMKKALAAMQDAVRKTKEISRKYYLYDHLAEIAFNVGKWSIAEDAAKKSVSLAGKFGNNWHDGNAIHNGNCILGRLSLRKRQFRKALFHLSEAGKTHGSPQLNSFGPNMCFAQEMLQAGQRDAVIKYLKACKRFWRGDNFGELSACISQIMRGGSPRLPRVL